VEKPGPLLRNFTPIWGVLSPPPPVPGHLHTTILSTNTISRPYFHVFQQKIRIFMHFPSFLFTFSYTKIVLSPDLRGRGRELRGIKIFEKFRTTAPSRTSTIGYLPHPHTVSYSIRGPIWKVDRSPLCISSRIGDPIWKVDRFPYVFP